MECFAKFRKNQPKNYYITGRQLLIMMRNYWVEMKTEAMFSVD